MKTKCSCRFCNIVNGIYNYQVIDKPFAENEDFLAISSLGSFIEGWTLIIPKKHVLSMKDLYPQPSLSDIVNSTIKKLGDVFGPSIAFEHGATQAGSSTACGTDHAHLHLVPLNQSLKKILIEGDKKWIECTTKEVSFLTRDKEYLFYTDATFNKEWDDPLGLLHILDRPESQFFRRVIARLAGIEDAFDYKKHPHLETTYSSRIILEASAA